MKYFIVLLFAATALYSQEITYYRIYADVKNDVVFKMILDETNTIDVFTDKYQIVVNTGTKYPFIVVGRYNSPDVEWDREAYRYDWLLLSKQVRDRLTLYRDKIRLK